MLVLTAAGCLAPGPLDCGPTEVVWVGETRTPRNRVDLLFVIGNSASMRAKQAALAAQLPDLLRALTTGDVDGNGEAELEPLHSLHVGIVTPDMGVFGHGVPTCASPEFGDDGLMRRCTPWVNPYLDFESRDPASGIDETGINEITCRASAGTDGCGFQQPLEAMLKALSPSVSTHADFVPPFFFQNTPGHGDRYHDGFLRPEATLAVVVLTDADDCSARDPELFRPDSRRYADTDLGLRCTEHAGALHAIDRYVEGLLSLRPADRLVFVPIVGVPVDLATDASGATDWEAIAGAPELRDPRLVERVDPSTMQRTPSCTAPVIGAALPPSRIVQTAHALSMRGARVAVESVCQASQAHFTTTMARMLRPPPTSAFCLALPLVRGEDGRVNCTLTLRLSSELGECVSVAGATARLRPNGEAETLDGRPVCAVAQRAVDATRDAGGTPPGDGFWVDEFSSGLGCTGPRAVLPRLPWGTRVELRCPRSALAESALDRPCDPEEASACGSDGALTCDRVTSRCAPICSDDRHCLGLGDSRCAIPEGAGVGVCRSATCEGRYADGGTDP